eukprot:TRINITY_DN1073_c0_g1_i2.p1 TRINITY_DN1073_c0_g1~~TRINITY_DN1073_c0_g1_i2.p1  ORF type:complete len:289 (-),score=37.77 TRINITY_DN1073_c0_g1_i2:62-928(-)
MMEDRTNLGNVEILFDSKNSQVLNDYFWETQQTNSFWTQQRHLHQMLNVQEQIGDFLNNSHVSQVNYSIHCRFCLLQNEIIFYKCNIPHFSQLISSFSQPLLCYPLAPMNQYNNPPHLYQGYPQHVNIYPIDSTIHFSPNSRYTPPTNIKQEPAMQFKVEPDRIPYPPQNRNRIIDHRRSISPIQFNCGSTESESLTGRKRTGSTSSSEGEESGKKRRYVWSPELSEAFEEAIETIGCESATAKNVLSLMSQKVDVSSLTRIRVANHVQYYRNRKNKLLINSFKNETQ